MNLLQHEMGVRTMKRYEIISYDVWGNKKDGYEVNNAFRTGWFIELPEDASDKQIRSALYRSGYCSRGILSMKIEHDGTGDELSSYYLEDNSVRAGGMPFCELRPID